MSPIRAADPVGGPLAVIANRLLSIPVQQRNERIIAAIQDDITALSLRVELADPETWLHSEEFLAAFHRTLRASQETPSDEQRKLLRNALLNGYVTPEPTPLRDKFLALMVRYEPQHVLVLEAVRSLMKDRTHALENTAATVREYLRSVGTPVAVEDYLRDLVRDRLVGEASESEVREQKGPPARWGSPTAKQITYTTTWNSNTARGDAFLEFVKDPLSD